MAERRTRFNLRRDGVETCAEAIVESVGRTKGCHSVYVDWRQDVRVIPDAGKQTHRPDDERIGRYRKGIKVEQVEDDLIAWQRELTRAA